MRSCIDRLRSGWQPLRRTLAAISWHWMKSDSGRYNEQIEPMTEAEQDVMSR